MCDDAPSSQPSLMMILLRLNFIIKKSRIVQLIFQGPTHHFSFTPSRDDINFLLTTCSFVSSGCSPRHPIFNFLIQLGCSLPLPCAAAAWQSSRPLPCPTESGRRCCSESCLLPSTALYDTGKRWDKFKSSRILGGKHTAQACTSPNLVRTLRRSRWRLGPIFQSCHRRISPE